MSEKVIEFYELNVLMDICLAEYRANRDLKSLEEVETYLYLLKEVYKNKGISK